MRLLIVWYFIQNVDLIKNIIKEIKKRIFFYLDPNVLLTASQDGYAKV